MRHTKNERNVENTENTLPLKVPEDNEIEDDYSDDTFEAESQDGDEEVIMDDGLDEEAVSAESQEAASSTVKEEAEVDPAESSPICDTDTKTDADVNLEDVQKENNQENKSTDKIVETKISPAPEVKENVAMQSSDSVKAEEPKSPITANQETVDKSNSPSEKNVSDKQKETSKSSLGLWFNTELRKQIQITPKGWELRSDWLLTFAIKCIKDFPLDHSQMNTNIKYHAKCISYRGTFPNLFISSNYCVLHFFIHCGN